MKNYLQLSIVVLASLLFNYNLFAQNPNWTLPPQVLQPQVGISNLPTPPGSYHYSGVPASNMHAAYSDPYGDVLLFTVDENVYDKNGYLVDVMQTEYNTKKGYNERLILPFGNDCSRFAIIYPASAETNEAYGSKLFAKRLYMAEYDMAAPNTYPNAAGALVYANQSSTLFDISERDATLYGAPAGNPYDIYFFNEYGYQEFNLNIQIAATELIDNCFYYVFVSDGKYLMRYKLSANGFDYDNYLYQLPNAAHDLPYRTEMELIKLKNGNYRLALFKASQAGTAKGILKLDISGQTATVLTNSLQLIPLNYQNLPDAEVYGLEFDPTGQYIYFTHIGNTALPNALDVYDLNASAYVSIPTLNGISNFRKSYIERYGDKMYLATNNYIGQLTNIANPGNLGFNSTFISITSGYGNSLSPVDYPSDLYFRYILPDQIDMPYANLADLSCECCVRWHSDEQKYTATSTQTWSPGANSNPFGSVDGTVTIGEELRIPAGTNITISNMKFYFGPTASVVVESANSGLPPGFLKLTNQTVFTADNSCSENPIVSCNTSENCEKHYWQGVRVQGDASDYTQSNHVQGNFTMEKESMIEYAEIGILVGSDAYPNLGGGIISIEDSRLKDNRVGIKFKPYTRHNGGTELFNKSGVYRTTFSTTNDWYEWGNPLAFIDIDNSSGLHIQGNHFENSNTNAGFGITNRGTGIKTNDSRIDASWACAATPMGCVMPVQNPIRNEFISLTYGIYGLNSGIYRTVTCNYGLFQNNHYGIVLSNYIQPQILDNTFEVPMKNKHVGLTLIASTGYDVQNNTFSTYGMVTQERNIGILVSNSGPGHNEIYRNNFQNLVVGGRIEGVNTDESHGDSGYADGLEWLCNIFDYPMYDADILLSGSMADEQGDCHIPSPARNLFSHSSMGYPNHQGLKSYSAYFYPIDYNHNPNTTQYPRLKPLKYSGQVGSPQYYQLQSCNGPSFNPETSCPIDLSGAPETEVIGPGMMSSSGDGQLTYASLSELLADYAPQITELENQLNTTGAETNGISDIESELAQLRDEYRKLWHQAITQYQSDTTGVISTAQLQGLLSEYTPVIAERFASILLPQANLNWISQSNLSGIEAFEGAALPAIVGDSLPLQIPEWFQSDFFATASNASALNALYIENDAIYEPYILPLEVADADWGGQYMPGNSGSAANAPQLSVQPNPFNENVHFDVSAFEIENSGTGNRIEFYDITGRKIFSEQIGKDQTQIDFAGERFPEGIVLYTLYVNNVPVENGKIIRVK